jgi:transcription-repair coupling factor (superfamily II helicase)
LRSEELLSLYTSDSFIKLLAAPIGEKLSTEPQRLQVKGVTGSLAAVIASSVYKLTGGSHMYIATDREEAAYFFNDLQNLLDREILLFPMSYKKPYLYEDVENANVLMRAEVLNKLNPAPKEGLLIVTYPEALSEKVINKRSLLANTLTIRVGEKLDTNFISELLQTYEFEKADFVYEAGQFSVRGGIVDVFSFASEFPYRIELFDDEVEGIRLFNPETQLSNDAVEFVKIIPNIQTKLIEETRESFFDFLPQDITVWAKDVEFTLEIIEKCFEKAEQNFESVLQSSGGIQVISNPGELFETRRAFLSEIKKFRTVEFGRKFYFKTDSRLQYNSKPQPSFNKDFKRLIETLGDNQAKGYTNIIAAESFKQIERLRTIFEELDPYVKFQPINIGLKEGFLDETLKIACFTDHQIFDRYYKYRVQDKFSKSKALTLRELKTLQPGDYVTHIDHGIGRFAGLEKVDNAGNEQEAIRLIYRDNDILLVSIHSLHKIAKYSGREGGPPTMSKLGSQEWENKKSRIRKQVKDIARELIALYAKRRSAPGFAYSRDSFLQVELESSFMYEDTPDQAKATNDIKDDM